MDIDDIKDRESLEAWLKTRPREDAVAIAHRAALRVFPLFGQEMGEEWARKRAFTCLHILRPLVVSGTIGKRTIPSISAGTRSHKPSADYAVFAAFSAARFAHSTASTMFAASAVDAAASANAARFNALVYGDLASKAYSIWHEVRRDASLVVKGQGINQSPLWPDTPPDWFTEADQETRAIWTENPAHWEFWTRWWDAAIAGTPLDWELQRDIALIPDYVWKQGPGAVAEAVREIEARHSKAAESEVQQELRKLPPAPAERISVVQKAMEANRKTLPPTFDAIEGLISLEIERLLMRNYVDELDRLESQRQIGVFLTLHEAVCGLRQSLPETGPITEQDAAKSEKLMRVYARKFAELPRAKADEVVEGVWDSAKGTVQAGLILGTTAMAMGLGLPALAGVTIGAMVFAPGRTGDIVKAAKEAMASGKGN